MDTFSPQNSSADLPAAIASTLPEFTASVLDETNNGITVYCVTGSVYLTRLSKRTADLVLYIMPGAELYVNYSGISDANNQCITKGRLKLICFGTFGLTGGNLIVTPNSRLDLSKADSISLSAASTLSLENGAAIILQDTPVTGSGIIKGHEAVLNAPPVQVFDQNISIEGTWAIDRAYPQWFTSAPLYSNVTDAEKATSYIDWAPAINNAIDMKNSGEVSLPRGVYPILSTIRTYYGIRLMGAGATSNVDWEHREKPENAILSVRGTILYVPLNGNKSFNKAPGSPGWNCITDERMYADSTGKILGGLEPYIMTVNYKNIPEISGNNESEQLFNYPGQPVVIEHIRFELHKDYIYTSQSSNININGIYLHGSVEFRHLSFHGFSTAIATDGRYSDRQSYFDIYYTRAWENGQVIKNENTVRFAFFIPGNGDGFIMESCAIGTYSKTSGLYLQKCNGGSVVNNIFNAQVVLDNCYNVVYSGNHMECGAQLVVKNSSVTADANYFEKGNMPSIKMVGSINHDKAILNLSNSQFLMYDGGYFYDELHEITYDSDGKKVITDKFMSAAFIARVKAMSQYDIKLDDNSILNLNSNFRNTLLWGFLNGVNLPKNYTYGIQIKASSDSAQSSLDADFNLRSSYLTPSCQIAHNKVIAFPTTIPTAAPTGASIGWWALTAQVPWVGPDITGDPTDPEVFYYKYCYLPEGVKYDGRDLDDAYLYPIQSNGSPDKSKDPLRPTKETGGIYLQALCSSTATRGNLYLRRIINDVVKEVYIPLCFTRMLYDNGITISSFKWI